MRTSPLKTMQILYKALLTGQVIFFGLAIWLRSRGMVQKVDASIDRGLQIAAVLSGFVLIWLGLWYYRKQIGQLKDTSMPVAEKLKAYQAVSIIKWSLTEGPNLLCAVGYLLTGTWSFLALGAVILFVFAGYNPQKAMVMRELGLGEEDLG
jgi:hypothetical protein